MLERFACLATQPEKTCTLLSDTALSILSSSSSSTFANEQPLARENPETSHYVTVKYVDTNKLFVGFILSIENDKSEVKFMRAKRYQEDSFCVS